MRWVAWLAAAFLGAARVCCGAEIALAESISGEAAAHILFFNGADI